VARQVRQSVPAPGPEYEEAKARKMAAALNNYMFQAQAQGEVVAGHFIMTDQPTSTVGLPVGTLYLKTIPGAGVVLSIVQEGDP
jgi:hypothetical protein